MLKDPTKVQSVDPVTNVVTLMSNAKASYGTKIIEPVSLGDIDGDGSSTSSSASMKNTASCRTRSSQNQIIGFLRAGGALDSGNGRTYALFHDGTAHGAAPLDHGWNPDAFMPGWPVKIAMLTTELLPSVGSGQDGPPALADLDHDGRPEIGIFSVIGPAYVFNGQGQSFLGADPSQRRAFRSPWRRTSSAPRPTRSTRRCIPAWAEACSRKWAARVPASNSWPGGRPRQAGKRRPGGAADTQ